MHTVAGAGSLPAADRGAQASAERVAARVAVAGATGYTGQELLRLLSRHPSVSLTAAMSSGQTGASSRPLPALSRLWDGAVVPLAPETLKNDIGVDAKSGVAGAGKTASEGTHFSEIRGSLAAYGVFNHRHGGEIEQGVGRTVTFTPHLVPIDRGILSTIYVRVAPGTTEEALADVYQQAYTGATFVRLVGSALPEVKHVAHTNFFDIGLGGDASGPPVPV